jgi:hypothetical protein
MYSKGSVLYRNVTPFSLMTTPYNGAQGYLLDLENATDLDGSSLVADGESPKALPLPAEGTPNFYSLDVLDGLKLSSPGSSPINHIYRHDLESFLYSLCWILTHCRRGTLVYSCAFAEWQSGDVQVVRDAKVSFLESLADGTFNVPPGFGYGAKSNAVLGTWIHRLGRLFINAYKAKTESFKGKKVARLNVVDDETLGGMITYEKFMNILESATDSADDGL